MGRELRRVPLDFHLFWPVGTVWAGYLNPYYNQSTKCHTCDGSQHNPETHLIEELFYAHVDENDLTRILDGISITSANIQLLSAIAGNPPEWIGWHDKITQDEVQALADECRLQHFTHTWSREQGWVEKVPAYIPTAAEVNELNGPRGRGGMGMGCHDAINRYILIEARAKRFGVYGMCPQCGGDGRIWPVGMKGLYEAWAPTAPPSGPAFQLWETTSEGSPVSPAFETLDELCAWCADNATTFGQSRATMPEWRRMLDANHVYHQEGNKIFL